MTVATKKTKTKRRPKAAAKPKVETKRRPGRPRETQPENKTDRSPYPLNLNEIDRGRLKRLSAAYSMRTGADALRMAIRNQRNILEVRGGKKVTLAETDMPTSPYNFWMNEAERESVRVIREGYQLSNDAEAHRYALRQEAKRVLGN